jgi:hypothetical protein
LAPDVRQRLAAFVAETEQFRVPATEAEIAREIAGLMVAFRSARAVATDEAMAMTREYADLLSDLPLWAVRIGFRKVKLGEADGVSLDFPPSAPRLRKVVTDEMVPLLTDRSNIQRVLSARAGLPDNPDRVVRPTLRQMKEKYGENLSEPPREVKPKFESLQGDALKAHYDRYGLGFEPKPQRHDDVTETVTVDVTFQGQKAVAR